MSKSLRTIAIVLAVVLIASWVGLAPAADAPPNKPAKDESAKSPAEGSASAAPPGGSPATGGPPAGTAPGAPRPTRPPFAEVVKDAKPIEGLIKLHRKDDRLYAELTGNLLDRDFIVLISIARGIGEGPVLGGMSWGFGDDWLWQFRKVDEKIQVVRRNVRFTAARGSPEERAVRLAYTDSVLFSMPIITTTPGGGHLVELSQVLMSDLPQISNVLPGFVFARDRSSWASVKGFPDNVEIEVAATYASGGTAKLDTVPDSRGLTVNVHYSISLLLQTGYQPRMADDRVGYFLTVTKDFSKKYDSDRFVRLINRWDLRKADPSAKLSPPRKPIIFWLEKTIPYEYRKPIGEGILEWNKAFEKAGFANAIEVRQQRDRDDWDPEDINYNTFRWITAGAGFAMGPSRVNPLSGEILDADIIFDADFLNYWKDEYDILTPKAPRAVPEAPPSLDGFLYPGSLRANGPLGDNPHCACQLGQGMGLQLALGAMALQAAAPDPQTISREEFEKLIMQAVKSIAMHEVGHTFGLRHNFKASSLLALDEINNPEKTRDGGLAASIMDYLPVNFMPKGQKQGDYFSGTIGPYDYWAIEYGYRPFGGGTEGETAELKKIAARAAEPALRYAPEEDCRPSDPDPLVNRFDLGKDPIQFAKTRNELVAQLVPGLVDRLTEPGEGYQRTRRAFNILLGTQGRATEFVARLVSGVYVNRSHKGDPGAKPPFEIVEPARQREALAYLQEHTLGEKAFDFPPQLYNALIDARWAHWGVKEPERVDFPVRDTILAWQDRVLAQLLANTTLSRLMDSELKVPADQDAFTAAELVAGLTTAVFRELDRLNQGEFTARKPAVSGLRRGLQRRYLERLGNLAMGNFPAPEDCQTLAYAQLEAVEGRIKAVLAGKAKLDPYTQAHLKESASRIRKVLDARLQLRAP